MSILFGEGARHCISIHPITNDGITLTIKKDSLKAFNTLDGLDIFDYDGNARQAAEDWDMFSTINSEHTLTLQWKAGMTMQQALEATTKAAKHAMDMRYEKNFKDLQKIAKKYEFELPIAPSVKLRGKVQTVVMENYDFNKS